MAKTAKISLTQGKIAIVDKEDEAYLQQWKWHCSTTSYKRNKRDGYARRTVPLSEDSKKRVVYMHQAVMRVMYSKKEYTIDHVNGNKLDNRKSNLRFATPSQQAHNIGKGMRKVASISRYKGVTIRYVVGQPCWVAAIVRNGKKVQITCKSEISAAKLYDKLARELFGEFARTNFK